ncbi:hypothetical protein CC80DRAFT_498377 [Byssothecium circinans]|uniref:F-box domain-containing protein n=1 Tax=Byssothecium circinans TaxID=147558 RepID=A0A6A5T8X6_9PLEO|nr:hypothetical protein CC80DRAFT_498377 [Byssothecium circinans]
MVKFLDLPAEIRCLIYDYCMFPEHDTVKVEGWSRKECAACVLQPRVFRLCRQIRIEAVIHLYKTKPIEIIDTHTVYYFIPAAGEYGKNYIQHLIFSMPQLDGQKDWTSFFNVLRSMRALKTLTFRLPLSIHDHYPDGIVPIEDKDSYPNGISPQEFNERYPDRIVRDKDVKTYPEFRVFAALEADGTMGDCEIICEQYVVKHRIRNHGY